MDKYEIVLNKEKNLITLRRTVNGTNMGYFHLPIKDISKFIKMIEKYK